MISSLVRGTLAGQQVETTFFHQMPGAIDQATLDSVAAAVAAWVIADFLPKLNGSYVSKEVYCFDMTSGATTQSTNTSSAGMTGSASGDSLPNNVTLAVARKSDKRGRSYSGRIFWPGMAQSQLAFDNIVDIGVAAAFVASLETLDTSLGLLDALAVVLSFTHDGVTTDEAVISAIAEWVVTDLVLDNRRRRLPGRGS